MKELTNYVWLLLTIILAVVGTVSAIPLPLYNTLQDYDGHHSQEDCPDQPAFLLEDGLDVTYVWDGSGGAPTANETVTFDTEGAHFGTVLADDYGRNYIRTLETDHISASFDAYITVVNYVDGQNVFIGMGAGEYGDYYCPDWWLEGVPTVWAELMEGAVNVMIWDGAVEDFLRPGGKVPTSSTYLMRLSYDADAQTIIFYTDADNDGTWDDISKECDVTNVFTENDITRIYVGTDDRGTLINFEVKPAYAYGFDPPNGARLVPEDKILSWNVRPDIIGALCDVYFGTDPNEGSPDWYGNYKIADMTAQTSCDPDLEKDTTYYWRVDVLEPNDTSGSYIVHPGDMLTFTTVPYIPVILTQPVSQTVEIGGSATFTVEGLNFETFAWYKEGGGPTVLSDQQQLVLDDIQLDDEGRYYCAISNDDGPGGATLTVMSDMASLWTKRLMAYWNFDDNLDSSQPLGPVWTGTAYMPDPLLGDTVISPTYDVDSISEKSLKFEADPNHVRINDSEYFFNFYTNGFTAAAWLKPAETGEWQLAVSKNNLTKTLGWGLGRYTDQAFANIRSAGVYDDYYGGSDINDGNWHLVVCQYDPDRATYSLFMDGVRVAESETVTTPIPASMVPLVIGAEMIDGNAPFDGLIDDVRIWSYALSPLEIAQLYRDFYTDAEVCIEQSEMWRYYDTVGQPGEPSYCKVDIEDFAEFMLVWMKCNVVPTCLQ